MAVASVLYDALFISFTTFTCRVLYAVPIPSFKVSNHPKLTNICLDTFTTRMQKFPGTHKFCQA